MQSRLGGEMIKNYQENIPNYLYHGGVPLPGALITKNFHNIEDFEVRQSDVLIAGYPRSGNHWIKEIVTHLYADELDEVLPSEDKHIYERIPILEMAVDIKTCLQVYMDKYFEKYGMFRPVLSATASRLGIKANEKFFKKVHIDTLEDLNGRPSPRLYHTHLPFQLLPDSAKRGECKIIVIMRNGKDVASSYYDMHKMYPPFGYYNGDWKEFLYTFLNGKVCFGSWFDHVLGWWAQHGKKNIHFVKYEDMIENLHKEVKKLADFLGKSVCVSHLDDIVAACTFESMKSNPNASFDKVHKSINTSQTSFLRKGKVGDWKTRMTVEDSEFFDMIFDYKKMGQDGPGFRFELN